MREDWRDIPGFEERYQASSLGKFRRHSLLKKDGRNKTGFLKPCPVTNGYLQVNLAGKVFLAHRMIALTFRGKCPKGLECAHLNGVKTDNRISNLVYVTTQENMDHKKIHGTNAKGERNGWSKLTAEKVIFIREQHKKGVSTASLATLFKVDPSTIRGINTRRSWRHI